MDSFKLYQALEQKAQELEEKARDARLLDDTDNANSLWLRAIVMRDIKDAMSDLD